MRVCLNRDKCKSCGVCMAVCPDIFAMDKNHIAFVQATEVPPVGDLQQYCQYAAADCPAKAIEVCEDKNRASVYPTHPTVAEGEELILHDEDVRNEAA